MKILSFPCTVFFSLAPIPQSYMRLLSDLWLWLSVRTYHCLISDEILAFSNTSLKQALVLNIAAWVVTLLRLSDRCGFQAVSAPTYSTECALTIVQLTWKFLSRGFYTPPATLKCPGKSLPPPLLTLYLSLGRTCLLLWLKHQLYTASFQMYNSSFEVFPSFTYVIETAHCRASSLFGPHHQHI